VWQRNYWLLTAWVGFVVLLAQEPTPRPTQPIEGGYRTVVLDPGHGGADSGARGGTGLLEKDLVLRIAHSLVPVLEREGWRVVLTRQGDELRSFDERAAVANAEPGAVFLSLHIGSTGNFGTARVYSFAGFAPEPADANPRAPGLLPWDRAQQPYLESSRRLAALLQSELARRLPGSPEAPASAAVRQLRNIAAPAVALELASVAVDDARALEALAPALAEAMARALSAFRAAPERTP
jgi:N-acetylmuramoyl-L-alanine amidase